VLDKGKVKSVLNSPFVRLKNKFFDGASAGAVFWGFLASWGVCWLAVGDTPSPARSIGIKTLAGFF
jgi:hypothetical protein